MTDNRIGLNDGEQMEDGATDVSNADKTFDKVNNTFLSNLNQFGDDEVNVSTPSAMRPLGSLLQIPITVRVILGKTKMPLSKVMALGPGSIVSLDQKISEPAILMVNGNEFARGMIVIIDEASGQLGVTITQISSESISIENPV